jgi:hypothetical protein
MLILPLFARTQILPLLFYCYFPIFPSDCMGSTEWNGDSDSAAGKNRAEVDGSERLRYNQ